jgi:hypothetical protein
LASGVAFGLVLGASAAVASLTGGHKVCSFVGVAASVEFDEVVDLCCFAATPMAGVGFFGEYS